MKNKKRKGIILLLAVFLFVLFQGVYKVVASSSYDLNYLVEDALTIEAPSSSCPSIDLSRSWSTFFKTATTSNTHFIPAGTLATAQNEFIDVVTSGVGSWAVSTEFYSSDSHQNIILMWSTVDGAEINFTGNKVEYARESPSNSIRRIVFTNKKYHTGSGGCSEYLVNLVSNVTTTTISTDLSGSSGILYRNAFVAGNYDINYPVGYSGQLIRTTYTPPNTYYPDFSYTVNGYDLRTQYQYNIPYDNSSLVNLRWRVVGKDTSDNYTNVLDDKDTPESGVYEYHFNSAGDYEIWLDYEIAPPGDLPFPDVTATTVQRIKIDGSSYSSSTKDSDCVNGVCNQPNQYEDCTIYGVDVVSGLGCVMRNFGVFLKSMLVSIFVPSSIFMDNYFTSLNTFIQDKLGFLVYPFAFLVEMFGDLITASATPDCSVDIDGTVFGADLAYDFCAFEDNFGSLWTNGIAMVRAVTVFGVVMALYRKFMSIMRGEQD